jgi:hypothetical protein
VAFDEDGAWIPDPNGTKRKKRKPRKKSRRKKKTTAKAATAKKGIVKKATKTKKVKAPAVHTDSKTEALTSRFRALLPDIGDLTNQIIEADFDYTKAIKVTSKVDDLVDWAPNAISWCADRRFLGMSPYAKQAEVLLAMFEEWCPRCSDKDYVRDIPVGDRIETVIAKVAMLEFGKCPHCGFTKGMGRSLGSFTDPNELVAVIGQRAGKSALSAMATSYLIHRNLMLPLPWQEYGLVSGQMLDFTFVATKKDQSEKTLWATFKGMFEASPWFKSYKEVSDLEGKKAGIPVTVKSLETYMLFGHKRLLIYFAANDPSGLRGSTRFGFAIDELAWFGSKEGGIRANGPETYAALSNACMTLRIALEKQLKVNPECNWPPPMGLNISSPRSMDDPLMTLYRDSAKNKRAVRRHWSTWEAHPEMTLQLLTDIGETAKPTFARDFGAQPPIADDPLVHRTEIVTEAFKSPLAIEKRYGPIIRPSAVGFVADKEMAVGVRTAKFLTAGIHDEVEFPDYSDLKALTEKDLDDLGPLRPLLDDLIQKPLHQRMHIMGVDLGAVNNALAVVCGCLAGDGTFITDFALEVKPRPGHTVNISTVYEDLIVKLVERLNVVAVFYDKWASLHQIQDLATRFGSLGPLNDPVARRSWLRGLVKQNQRPAFIADHYSLTMADARMLIARMEQGDCLFPAMEVPFMDLMVNQQLDATLYPYTHLALQAATVRARGSRLLKPTNRDDDIFRAWTNAAVPAFTDELVIDLLGQDVRAEPGKKQSSAAFHVFLGQAGKGIRSVENAGGGATSNSGTQDFPVVSGKGTFRG